MSAMSLRSLQDRVRERIRALVDQKGVNHETLGNYLGLSRSAVTRLLNDDGGIALAHIERLCEFFQITPAELMVEPGAQIQPVSPLESTILVHVRQMTELERRSLLTLLDRHLTITTPRRAGLGRMMLTTREQELVDLFARSDDGAREGVLKVLRGSAAARQAQQKTSG
jgi:transcriptional regulator with XRE-family HTH domain